MNLGVDPKHADQMVRGVCTLPNGTGRTQRVAVFARAAKAEEAKAAGADVVGAEDLVEQVSQGNINFDRCIATPDMMGLVGRLGKVLGPRGLMPNPRVGTVTMDVTSAVKGAKGGAVEFRVEKAGIVQAGVGKASFADRALVENIRAFVDAVIKAKPPGAKGNYLNKISLSSSQGVGVKIDAATVAGAPAHPHVGMDQAGRTVQQPEPRAFVQVGAERGFQRRHDPPPLARQRDGAGPAGHEPELGVRPRADERLVQIGASRRGARELGPAGLAGVREMPDAALSVDQQIERRVHQIGHERR